MAAGHSISVLSLFVLADVHECRWPTEGASNKLLCVLCGVGGGVQGVKHFSKPSPAKATTTTTVARPTNKYRNIFIIYS